MEGARFLGLCSASSLASGAPEIKILLFVLEVLHGSKDSWLASLASERLRWNGTQLRFKRFWD